MSDIRYFKVSEFACKCCGEIILEDELIEKLDIARSIAGIPFTVSSGYRCKSNNKTVGGSPKSSHMNGSAADIACRNSHARSVMINALIESGFNRIGIANTFIHVDVDSNKPKEVIWTY